MIVDEARAYRTDAAGSIIRPSGMAIYRDRVLPYLIDASMRNDELMPYRRRVISAAAGRVLEIGGGSGLNFALYPSAATRIVALELSPRLLEMAKLRAGATDAPVALVRANAERIPLLDHSVDTIVMTWTLCSVGNVALALREMRRVLQPGGRLLFAEHGASAEPRVRRWQNRLTPIWKHIAGGCHLNRPVRELLENAGFEIEHMDQSSVAGPKVLTCMYEGRAR